MTAPLLKGEQKKRNRIIALMERKTVMLLRKAVMEEAGPRTLKRNKGNKFGFMDRPFSMDCTLKRILVKKEINLV